MLFSLGRAHDVIIIIVIRILYRQLIILYFCACESSAHTRRLISDKMSGFWLPPVFAIGYISIVVLRHIAARTTPHSYYLLNMCEWRKWNWRDYMGKLSGCALKKVAHGLCVCVTYYYDTVFYSIFISILTHRVCSAFRARSALNIILCCKCPIIICNINRWNYSHTIKGKSK